MANRTNQDKPITVHLIAHSHMDAGWHKTPDEYFTGQLNENAHAASKVVFDAVLDEVVKDPRRRFCIADIKFLTMWYKNIDEQKKKMFKELVKSG